MAVGGGVLPMLRLFPPHSTPPRPPLFFSPQVAGTSELNDSPLCRSRLSVALRGRVTVSEGGGIERRGSVGLVYAGRGVAGPDVNQNLRW